MKTAPRLLSWYLKKQGYRAITLPPFGIYAIPGYENTAWIERHENVHWQQYKRMGFFRFYLTYFWYQIRYGYINNPMEIEARKAEWNT